MEVVRKSFNEEEKGEGSRCGEDDLLVLLTGGTTARAEQGDGVGDEEEVGDGSWLGQRGRAGEAEQHDRGH